MPKKPDKCRSCGAPIYWCRSERTGALSPIDAEPVKNGNVALQQTQSGEMVAVYLKKGDLFEQISNSERYQSHYVSCPDAEKWRKSKTRDGES